MAILPASWPPCRNRLEEWLKRFELGTFADWRARISSVVMQGSQLFAARLVSFGQNTLQFFIGFGIMLFTFCSSSSATVRMSAKKIRRAIPLSDDYTRQFLEKFTAVIRATVKGNIIIAIIQGMIGGVTFWLLGIEAALLWGVIMTFCSMLPAVGAALDLDTRRRLVLCERVTGGAAPYLLWLAFWSSALSIICFAPPLVGKGTRSARLCRADFHRGRHIIDRYKWLRHRAADCRHVYRRMVASCRRAERSAYARSIGAVNRLMRRAEILVQLKVEKNARCTGRRSVQRADLISATGRRSAALRFGFWEEE
ncbi:AI-2E family transporter [Brucella abortus]|nr:AI-2E family transporter [Brucella abortus]